MYTVCFEYLEVHLWSLPLSTHSSICCVFFSSLFLPLCLFVKTTRQREKDRQTKRHNLKFALWALWQDTESCFFVSLFVLSLSISVCTFLCPYVSLSVRFSVCTFHCLCFFFCMLLHWWVHKARNSSVRKLSISLPSFRPFEALSNLTLSGVCENDTAGYYCCATNNFVSFLTHTSQTAFLTVVGLGGDSLIACVLCVCVCVCVCDPSNVKVSIFEVNSCDYMIMST